MVSLSSHPLDMLQDLLGFRLDQAVEEEKGASSGLVSLARPASSDSGLAEQGNCV